MSRFMTARHASLTPYTPGEQPRERQYIKLNTNESPFPPSPAVIRAASEEAAKLQLYSDPLCRDLNKTAAAFFGVGEDQILMTNGSDEILNFAFMAFGDEDHPFAFADVTYGFYPVFATLSHIPYREIPLKDDLSLDLDAFLKADSNIVIANPNAPTGLLLSPEEIERVVVANRGHVVIVDEAYIDFGGLSVLPLISKYDNLLVTRTFSKSYSMAGARLGFGIGAPSLIADLNTIKYSTNPYNVNRMSMAAGRAALEDAAYFRENCKKIESTRAQTANELRALGFFVSDSMANFLFIRHPELSGETLYLALRERGILVRHFSLTRIKEYNRVTVGTDAEMAAFLDAVKIILKEGMTK